MGCCIRNSNYGLSKPGFGVGSGNSSYGGGSGGGAFGATEGEEPEVCAADGDPPQGLTEAQEWYDPDNGDLYKDRTEGDGLDAMGRQTPNWPGPDSIFKDGAKKPKRAKPFPPPIDPTATDPVTGETLPGGGSPGGMAGRMCATHAMVNINIIKHASTLGLQSSPYGNPDMIAHVHQILAFCLLRCYNSTRTPPGYKRRHTQGPGAGRQIGDGLINKFGGAEVGANLLAMCKEECWESHVQSTPGKPYKVKPRKYPKGGNPRSIPDSPWPPGGTGPVVQVSPFTCPPYGVGEIVVMNIVVVLVKMIGGQLRATKMLHTVVVEIIGCGNNYMKVRHIEQDASGPRGGGALVTEFDKNGKLIGTTGYEKFPGPPKEEFPDPLPLPDLPP